MRFKLSEWPCERLERLETNQQLAFAEEIAGNLVQRRVLLGRILLVIQRSESYEEFGASSVHHYAALKLGERDAREAMLVAQRLEELPLLTEAVENDRIVWCKLRAVLRRATPETEAHWLAMADRWSVRALERMLNDDARGERGHRGTSEADTVQLRLEIPAELMGLIQRAIRDLSSEARQPLSFLQALECLAAERLSGRAFPDEKEWARLRDDVQRDLEARREREQEAPWEAAAATETECPGEPELSLVQAARVPHWQNNRLQFNEEARGVTPAQRREILRRDGYACSVPDCPHKLWLEMHHIVFFCEGGATVPANLVAVCSRCHRHIHRGLLHVHGDAPRGLRWFDRLGRELGRASRELPLAEPAGFAEEFLLWFGGLTPNRPHDPPERQHPP